MRSNLIGDISAVTLLLSNSDYEQAQRFSKLFKFKTTFHLNESLDEHSLYPLNKDTDLKLFSKLLSKSSKYNHTASYNDSKSDIRLLIQLPNGTAELLFSKKKIQSPTTYIFLSWVVGAAMLMLVVAIVFMKNQVRSILQLAEVAERLGKGLEIPKFKPSGATEVKTAGWAFIRMHRRIKRQIQYRTELLSHISHDLRTPLTRIKLTLAMLNSTKNDEDLKSDIKEMEKLIDSYLNFAKEEGNEKSVSMEFIPYILSVVSNVRDERLKLCIHCEEAQVYFKPEAFKRALYNLINNALKHCKSKVSLSIKVIDHHLNILIEDDGKGIDQKHWKHIFKPFYKIDKDSEGFGLGLAITKSIVYNHGGIIKLSKSKLGGLKVTIQIPI
jgi:two-component system osmolarity sensor histidine kinase EnvZ